MASLAAGTEKILISMNLVSLKNAGSTTLYMTPAGKTTVITKVVFRNMSASLVGGTSYSLTGFRQGFSLATLITPNTGCIVVYPTDLSQLTMIAASTALIFTVTTGSTAAATGTIDVFGYTF